MRLGLDTVAAADNPEQGHCRIGDEGRSPLRIEAESSESLVCLADSGADRGASVDFLTMEAAAAGNSAAASCRIGDKDRCLLIGVNGRPAAAATSNCGDTLCRMGLKDRCCIGDTGRP